LAPPLGDDVAVGAVVGEDDWVGLEDCVGLGDWVGLGEAVGLGDDVGLEDFGGFGEQLGLEDWLGPLVESWVGVYVGVGSWPSTVCSRNAGSGNSRTSWPSSARFITAAQVRAG
jgi:hypothetical protein